jgi:hypothetical protein
MMRELEVLDDLAGLPLKSKSLVVVTAHQRQKLPKYLRIRRFVRRMSAGHLILARSRIAERVCRTGCPHWRVRVTGSINTTRPKPTAVRGAVRMANKSIRQRTDWSWAAQAGEGGHRAEVFSRIRQERLLRRCGWPLSPKT